MKKICALIAALIITVSAAGCATTTRSYRRNPYNRVVREDYTFGDVGDEYTAHRRTVLPNTTDMPATNGRRVTRNVYGGSNNRVNQDTAGNRGLGEPFAANNDGAIRNGLKVTPDYNVNSPIPETGNQQINRSANSPSKNIR